MSINQKRRPLILCLFIVITFFVYLALDYLNILCLLGLSLDNVNMDVFNIAFNTTVLLILYVISFFFIDNRQNEKDVQARETAYVLLASTYKECIDNLNLLNNREMIEKYIIPKIDGNKTDSENKVINNLQMLPFSTKEAIMQLAENGYVSRETLIDYLQFMKEYRYLISVRIVFYDLTEPQTIEQQKMADDIKARNEHLLNLLSSSIQIIQSHNKETIRRKCK